MSIAIQGLASLSFTGVLNESYRTLLRSYCGKTQMSHRKTIMVNGSLVLHRLFRLQSLDVMTQVIDPHRHQVVILAE